MSGLSAEVGAEFKAPFNQLKAEIEKQFPREEVYLEEKYTCDPLRGHRLVLKTYVKNKDTHKKIKIAENIFKIPQHLPKWLTKHDLWHHTYDEINLLMKLKDNNGEKSPSKNTLQQWRDIIAENVRKANNNHQQIPIPKIG
jgi:hypothetical protein